MQRAVPSSVQGIHSFGELSQFLRGCVADEASREVSESMGLLANHVEAIVAALRLSRRRDLVAPQMVDFLTVLREHRNLVAGLGLPWRGLYEHAGYLQALNNFRAHIGQCLLEGAPRSTDLRLSAQEFEQMAWRTLGEGMLLIDMHDQWVSADARDTVLSDPDATASPQFKRARQWWKKLGL